MKHPLHVRVRLLGTAVFSYLAYRSAPREIKPFLGAMLTMSSGLHEIDNDRRWGIISAPWSFGADHDHDLAREMSARVGAAASLIRAEMETREASRSPYAYGCSAHFVNDH